jgi:serine O-acetyltransferase
MTHPTLGSGTPGRKGNGNSVAGADESHTETWSAIALAKFIFQDWQSNKDHTIARAVLVTYRIGHLAHRSDVPIAIAGPLRGLFRLLRMFFFRVVESGDIDWRAEVGPRLVLPHGLAGIFINGNCRIGADVVICQQVSLGVRDMGSPNAAPTIGNEVVIWAGAKIIGGVIVGDRAAIGANSVVSKDIPADSVAVGIPAQVRSA